MISSSFTQVMISQHEQMHKPSSNNQLFISSIKSIFCVLYSTIMIIIHNRYLIPYDLHHKWVFFPFVCFSAKHILLHPSICVLQKGVTMYYAFHHLWCVICLPSLFHWQHTRPCIWIHTITQCITCVQPKHSSHKNTHNKHYPPQNIIAQLIYKTPQYKKITTYTHAYT